MKSLQLYTLLILLCTVNLMNVLYLCQNILGRLLAMLFDWYDATAYLRDGMYILLLV